MTKIAAKKTAGVLGDDLGLYLSNRSAAFARAVGNGIVSAAPYLMKSLSIIGMAAMFMVGGGILTHGVLFCTTPSKASHMPRKALPALVSSCSH